MPRPRTIHDFYELPHELFDVEFPPTGRSRGLKMVADVCHPRWMGHDIDSRDIDHGTWSVLTHVFPDASVPVVQMSLSAL